MYTHTLLPPFILLVWLRKPDWLRKLLCTIFLPALLGALFWKDKSFMPLISLLTGVVALFDASLSGCDILLLKVIALAIRNTSKEECKQWAKKEKKERVKGQKWKLKYSKARSTRQFCKRRAPDLSGFTFRGLLLSFLFRVYHAAKMLSELVGSKT